MVGQLKLLSRLSISIPLALKRTTTTASTTDASTASSVDDANPDGSGIPQKDKRQRDNQNGVNINQNFKDSNSNSSCITHNISNDSCKSSCNSKRTIRSIVKDGSSRRSVDSSVSFGEVTIREYDRSIGDVWDIQHGLGLGWNYVDMPAVPLPNDDEESEDREAKIGKKIRKLKDIIQTRMLIKRKKRKSRGLIHADSLTDVQETKSKVGSNIKKMKARRKKRGYSYEEKKSSPQSRQELLQNFGFTSSELDVCERERQLLRVEYSSWTHYSRRNSELFLKRCLADPPHQ